MAQKGVTGTLTKPGLGLGVRGVHRGRLCIPPSYNSTVDASADLPGPGAVALPGQAQALP